MFIDFEESFSPSMGHIVVIIRCQWGIISDSFSLILKLAFFFGVSNELFLLFLKLLFYRDNFNILIVSLQERLEGHESTKFISDIGSLSGWC